MAFDFKREMNKIEAPVISFENVSKAYQKGVSALKNVNLTIHKGEFVFIVGDSGSGKSTMIKLMLKETVPTKGKVYVAGHSIARLRRTRVALYRRSIGVVFQDFRLLKDRNVFENVAFAQRVVGAGPTEIRHQVPKMLSLVGLSDKLQVRANRRKSVVRLEPDVFNFKSLQFHRVQPTARGVFFAEYFVEVLRQEVFRIAVVLLGTALDGESSCNRKNHFRDMLFQAS